MARQGTYCRLDQYLKCTKCEKRWDFISEMKHQIQPMIDAHYRLIHKWKPIPGYHAPTIIEESNLTLHGESGRTHARRGRKEVEIGMKNNNLHAM